MKRIAWGWLIPLLVIAHTAIDRSYAADVSRGKTFGSNEQVTNTKLHQLVDDATVSDIVQADMIANSGIAVRTTTAPTDTDAIWVDTTFTPPTLKRYDGSSWVPISESTFARLTNKSGGTLTAGDVVVVGTSDDSSFTTTTSASNTAVIGVVWESITNNSTGAIVTRGGPVTVKTTGTVSRGDFLVTSTSAGRASAVSSVQSGIFGRALTAASGTSTVQALLIDSSGASGGTPALTLSTSNSGGSATTFIRTDATVLAFDATVPTTQAFSDAAATGSAGVAARRDHVHGMPARPDDDWEFIETLTLTGSSSIASSVLPTTTDLIKIVLQNCKSTSGTLLLRFDSAGGGSEDTGTSYNYYARTGTSIADNTSQTGFHLATATEFVSGEIIIVRESSTPSIRNYLIANVATDIRGGKIMLNGAHDDGSAPDITKLFFNGGTMSGKVHIFKLRKQ